MKKKLIALISLLLVCFAMIPVATAACAHNYKWEIVTAATCKKTGLRRQVCTKCHAKGAEETIAKEHVYPNNGKYDVKTTPTCQHTGYQERKCSVCGHLDFVNTPKVKHSYTKEVIHRAATCKVKGKKIYECKWCGRNDNDHPEEIPVNPKNHTHFKYEKVEWVREKGQYKYKKICSDCDKFVEYVYRDK